MLTVMRDKLSGWITWTIIIGISLVFVLFGISNYFESGPQSSQTVATVGDLKITQNELTNAMNNLSRQYPEKDNSSLKEMALKALTEAKLNVASAENMGADLSTAQLDQTIYQIPAFQENGQFSENLFQYFISRNGLTLSEIRNDIKDNAISNQVAYGIAGSSFVLPDEMKSYVNAMMQTRDIEQTEFLAKSFSDKALISEDDIQSYYNAHEDSYKTPAKISLDYIELSVDQLAKDINPTEEQALAYYEANKSSFYKPESREYSQITLLKSDHKDANLDQIADDVIKQARSGESFSELVEKYSDDILAKKNNGDMGWVEQSSNQAQNNAINNTLFSLKNKDDISAPIKTDQGIDIVKLTGIKKASQQPFYDVKAEIIKRIQLQKAEREYSSLGNEMSNLAFENPQSLDIVARKLNLKVQTTPLFAKDTEKEGIASNQQVVDAAFSDNVLQDKNNSDPINISDTESVIIHLHTYQPAETKPLASVKSEIESILKAKKEDDLAKQEASKVALALNDSKSKSTDKYDFKTITDISRTNKSLFPLQVQAYMSAKVSSKDQPNYQVVKLKEGYGVFAVTKITPPDNNEMQNMMYGQLLQQTYGSYIYQLYLSEIKKVIPVEIKN